MVVSPLFKNDLEIRQRLRKCASAHIEAVVAFLKRPHFRHMWASSKPVIVLKFHLKIPLLTVDFLRACAPVYLEFTLYKLLKPCCLWLFPTHAKDSMILKPQVVGWMFCSCDWSFLNMIFLFVPVAENSPSLPSTLHLQKILKYQKTRTMSKCSAFARDHLSSTIYYEYITTVPICRVYIFAKCQN
jgi:hypothetical protein